jgi:hypothetical protein
MNDKNDDKKESPPVQEPSSVEPAPKVFGLPLDMFVRGGTSSSANDKRIAELKFESQRRREVADQERAIAQVPVEQGGGKLFTNKLTDDPDVEQAYVELRFVTARGEPVYHNGEEVKCLADITVLDADELAIIMVCPSCFSKTNVPLDQCQIRIRQSNKRFELDTSKAGELILWVEGRDILGKAIVKPYRSAGLIRECERFQCDCGWSARIVNNKVYPA